jgi:pyruvate/2-oxoglutarate dehydrogenase complex dihydrolipoamide acyltransferase (E2) component
VAREFRLPDIGEGLTEAEIVRWLVPVGGFVEQDQPVVEVETDKAVVEIPSPYAGVVLAHGGAEGETIAVGSVLVVIGEPGETPDEGGDTAPAAEDALADDAPGTGSPFAETPAAPVAEPAPAAAPSEPAPIVGTLMEEPEVLTPPSAPAAPSGRGVKALPVVRKLARDHGIDIDTIQGTGPGGRVTREDVERAIAARQAAPVAAQAAPAAEAFAPAPSVPAASAPAAAGPRSQYRPGRQQMTRLRRTIAANMSRSWAEIPHVTTFEEVDATRLLEVREALGRRHGVKISVEALVIKAVVPALQAFPEFNATIDGDDLVVHERFDIGIAVDTPEGLMVAVVRDAAGKGVLDLAAEVRRLGEGARNRTLGVDELTGQTFTVSNIGAVGGGHGTPIVPYGTTAILSVGMARPKPVVSDDDLVIAPVMPLSLSYDHRVIDGAQGRRFIALVIENLEEPALFLTS